jgi:hypothetical protein
MDVTAVHRRPTAVKLIGASVASRASVPAIGLAKPDKNRFGQHTGTKYSGNTPAKSGPP